MIDAKLVEICTKMGEVELKLLRLTTGTMLEELVGMAGR